MHLTPRSDLMKQKTEFVRATEDELDFDKTACDGFNAFMNQYDTYDSRRHTHRFARNFWTEAEMIEIVVDAYHRTGEDHYRKIMDGLYEGFLVDWRHQEKNGWWAKNAYNDDIMWMVIACARMYLETGDRKYLNTAKINFDNAFTRAWSIDLGGGLWWRTDNRTKNACVNGPGAIAACLLGTALQEKSYFEKAENLYAWERANLYEPDTGHVDDAYPVHGEKNTWASTYNQGTFIGMCTLLYEHSGNEQYIKDADRAANYAMETMYRGEVMNNEEGGPDLPGFKGILTRWLNHFLEVHPSPQYAQWLQRNARTAWENRSESGITGTRWAEKTRDSDKTTAWSASAAVALYQNAPNFIE
ncbi:MAG TPA: hypothetical protein DDW86_09460 [Clostridiales bacterium]|jgi:predicted alpha-1,6-mannanase (GH76 family)|nr:hypothetical protein [Clostridiales bacterium]